MLHFLGQNILSDLYKLGDHFSKMIGNNIPTAYSTVIPENTFQEKNWL